MSVQFPWYKWHRGAVPIMSSLSFEQQGFLLALGCLYLEKNHSLPDKNLTTLASYLFITEEELSRVWTPENKRLWEFMKVYLDDQKVSIEEAREALKERIKAAKAKKAQEGKK